MTGSRLDIAFPVAPEGRVLVLNAPAGAALDVFDPARLTVVQGQYPVHQTLLARGFDACPDLSGDWRGDLALVFLPRAKAAARALIHQAVSRVPDGASLWIDGRKTDGIDAILKEVKALTDVAEVHSKAHGKIFRLTAGPWVPADWAATTREAAPGFHTVPGVFSADGIDPGSAMLAAHLPDKMPTRVVDLGAGWGWLSAQVLARSGVEMLHLVESDYAALQSARLNVADPRAQFHWADARDFRLPDPVNGVVMNPPFHQGRDADPGLGRDFIAAAARLLTGAGRLWMVANRHLPYETTLAQHFGKVMEIGGDSRFKVIEATGARRPKGPRR
ncbi:MAG: class I SAM-dependent methyltransferase [Paracoccus sp. (in: a-proteobacteria)]|uniref:class I SAM-dependent methyltransferase n=1 Tax=Paracoccus sp. TaxID=267 RepID=UPI0026E0125B|nr:class I SAM-dependent methyltransferase [Paracoccus sp. (in: a-proteobacteria)]MDO5630978.1 class I SAM-dependent methyltransferase [Paracoccus sp. (in: a-proteobacteria)]